MVFAWQLGRPSPPHTYTHTSLHSQNYSSIPALLISREDKEKREAQRPQPLLSSGEGGAGPHRAALGSPPGPWMTLLPHGALQLAQIWVYLATELALKTHSKAVNLASEASALTDRDVGSLFTFWRGLLIRHPPLIIQAYRGVCL